MFPTTDFNFVVCGLATIAATVGYACTRKLHSCRNVGDGFEGTNMNAGPSNGIAPAEMEGPNDNKPEATSSSSALDFQIPAADEITVEKSPIIVIPHRRESLKRKIPHDGFEDRNTELDYPYNLANIYPNKRSRTPSSDSKEDVNEPVTQAIEPSASFLASLKDEDVSIPFVNQEPEAIVAPSAPRTPSPAPQVPLRPNSPETLPTLPMTPEPVNASPSIHSPRGFAAFAGSSSPFASVKLSPLSPSKKAVRSIWRSHDSTESTAESSSLSDNASKFEGPNTSFKQKKHAILAALTPNKPTIPHVTGEENEDVELELKGVKLYVKRGTKPFSDGMVGHVKLLSDKSTLEERILFRREPLWKISMNIRVSPAVRCTYDADERVVRVVLKEPIEQEGVPQQDWANEIVIYALKPGRSCSKQDFKEFAESLVSSAHFKSTS
ncbi:hypothetical protein BDQ12DRAFT_690261 [Crucibulum laeve]|uniref:RanBD1 domain-containing protein n=1 Tax=Crucibulum laeve TaxID=68775 RepID=A0A5C3LN62_9AGAR|nr:hypothetical protein BDQ12DRAFT_690261 [Crucibulum laeve]